MDDYNDKQFAAEHFSVEDDPPTDELSFVDKAEMKYLADSATDDNIDITDEPVEATESDSKPDVEETDTQVPDSPYAGMTEAELRARLEMEEKRRRDLQSWSDKRHQDLERQIQQVQEKQNQPAPQPTSITREDIKSAVEQNPIHAFQWTVVNAPDRISEVISNIREVHGNEMGDEAQVAFAEFRAQQIQAHYDQQFQERDAAAQQAQAPEIIRRGMEQIVDDIASEDSEGFKRVAPRVMELVQGHWEQFTERGDVSPYSVRDFIQRQVIRAYREEALKQSSAPQKPVALKPGEQVEGGTPGGSQGTERSDEDIIADEIVEAYNRSTYV